MPTIDQIRKYARTLEEAPTKARTLARSLQDAIGKANTYKDPMLSAEGLRAKRAELAKQFREAGRGDLDTLETETGLARAALRELAQEELEVPSDPAALIRAEQKWKQVETRINAGHDLSTIIRQSDAVTARAIAEWAPSWLSTQTLTHPGLNDQIRGWLGKAPDEAAKHLREAIYARLAEVSTDQTTVALMTAATAADGHIEAAGPWLRAARHWVEYGEANMFDAAVESAYTSGPARAERDGVEHGPVDTFAAAVDSAYTTGLPATTGSSE